MNSGSSSSINDVAGREDTGANHLTTFNAVSFNNTINIICTRARTVEIVFSTLIKTLGEGNALV
jgi:hypothetical protein